MSRSLAEAPTKCSPILLNGARRPPRLYPPVDLRSEHIHGNGAIAQHLAVKISHIEGLAQLRLRFGAQCTDVQLAELVAERLAGPDDVALHFGDHIALRHR